MIEDFYIQFRSLYINGVAIIIAHPVYTYIKDRFSINYTYQCSYKEIIVKTTRKGQKKRLVSLFFSFLHSTKLIYYKKIHAESTFISNNKIYLYEIILLFLTIEFILVYMCMCECACVYACLHAYMRICVCVCAQVFMRVHIRNEFNIYYITFCVYHNSFLLFARDIINMI